MPARQHYSLAAALIALLVMAAAAGTASGALRSVSNGTGASAAADGTLQIALTTIGTAALDPLKGPNNNGVYLRLMFDPLVGVDPTGTKLSKSTGIARDWQIAADGKTYTFTLRPGVKFHDGTEVTAADVLFTLQRLADPGDLTTTGKTLANQIESLRSIGKYKVQVRLKTPTATLLYRLSPLVDVAGLVVSKKYFDRVGQSGFDQHPMGSGPYRLTENQVGSSMTFQAVQKHWLLGKPRYDKVIMKIVPVESTRVAMLRSGEADFIDAGIEQTTALKKAGFQVFKHGSVNPLLLWMNLGNVNSPLRDINVRKALSYAINRPQLNKFLFANQGQITGNIFPSQLGNVSLQADPFNVAMAKQALGQSVFGPGGRELTLELNAQVRSAVPQMLQVAQTIQSYWKQIGVNANIIYGDYATWRGKAVARTLAPNAVELLDIGGRPDNSDTSVVWLSCSGLLSQACDRQMDKLAAKWSGAQGEKAYSLQARLAEKYARNRYLVLPIVGLPVYFVGDANVAKNYSVGQIALGFHVQGLVWNR
jgi:peptide/nickel transport system substrate-binding protein